ncbi:hypothetical protein ACEQ8H_001329 [Pleosporales sp. CAS-2024a]
MVALRGICVAWSVFAYHGALGHTILEKRNSDTGTQAFSANLLHESMNWMDMFYDRQRGYLFNLDAAALTHETRSSAWYAAGLLARNQADDVEQAVKIAKNIIGAQFNNVSQQWYGDYQIYPEQPTVGTAQYQPDIYNSWDPNWRGFVGTTFIVMLEEFAHLLPADVQEYMMQSLYNTTIGDSYRVGGVDDDNLYPAYSNPSIMRALVSGWVGRRMNDSNMTVSGEKYANQIIHLFTRADTLSEFNSGTYAGVSLYAMTLWAKYMPQDSLMGQYGPKMIKDTWTLLAQLYNVNLRNVAGPWDRSYGYDMNRYLSILALQMWTVVGKAKAPMHAKPYAMGHKDDFAISPLIAILAPYHNTLIPDAALASLHTFPGTHSVRTSAFSPPYDTYPRNISAWISPNLTIGAESFAENVVGGPARSQTSFNPAVVQWLRKDGSVGFLNLHAQVYALDVDVGQNYLELSYPHGGPNSSFSFLVGTNGWEGKRDVATWEDVEGLRVHVSGTVAANYTVGFAGQAGGDYKPVNDFEFWNFTYRMPKGSAEVPSVRLEMEVV